MILVLSATEIIACAVDKHIMKNAKSNNMSIRISRLHKVARLMEDEIPSLLTDCDMIAIEECQYEFRNHIQIQTASICIEDVQAVRPRMVRYLPSDKIYTKLLEKL